MLCRVAHPSPLIQNVNRCTPVRTVCTAGSKSTFHGNASRNISTPKFRRSYGLRSHVKTCVSMQFPSEGIPYQRFHREPHEPDFQHPVQDEHKLSHPQRVGLSSKLTAHRASR